MIQYGPCKKCKQTVILFAVKNELFKMKGNICLECFRKMLKRDLNMDDFKNILCNEWINQQMLDALNKGINVSNMYCKKFYK